MTSRASRELMRLNTEIFGGFGRRVIDAVKIKWFKARVRRYTYHQYDVPEHWVLPQRLTPKLERKLNSLGLLYDDLVWGDQVGGPVVAQALKRLEPEVYEMRIRRLDRANDLMLKHITIPEHLFNHQGKPLDPRNMYLTPICSKIYHEEYIHRDLSYKYE